MYTYCLCKLRMLGCRQYYKLYGLKCSFVNCVKVHYEHNKVKDFWCFMLFLMVVNSSFPCCKLRTVLRGDRGGAWKEMLLSDFVSLL